MGRCSLGTSKALHSIFSTKKNKKVEKVNKKHCLCLQESYLANTRCPKTASRDEDQAAKQTDTINKMV